MCRFPKGSFWPCRMCAFSSEESCLQVSLGPSFCVGDHPNTSWHNGPEWGVRVGAWALTLCPSSGCRKQLPLGAEMAQGHSSLSLGPLGSVPGSLFALFYHKVLSGWGKLMAGREVLMFTNKKIKKSPASLLSPCLPPNICKYNSSFILPSGAEVLNGLSGTFE